MQRIVRGISTLLVCCLIFCSSNVLAQPHLDWAHAFTGPNVDVAVDVTVDPQGNSIAVGRMASDLDFDPGTGVTMLQSTGNNDPVAVKLDVMGELVWAKHLTPMGLRGISTVESDNQGNVYFGGLGNANIVKCDPNGNVVWAHGFGDSTWNVNVHHLAVDASGNVCLSGIFYDTVDFDPGPASFPLIAATSNNFVAKYDANGQFLWAERFRTYFPATPGILDVAFDAAGNIVLGGFFANGTIDFDPGPASFHLTAAAEDIVVCKIDASGSFLWAKQMGGSDGERCNAIAVDPNGMTYLTGYFFGTTDFDPGVAVLSMSSQSADQFVEKLDANGNLVWVKFFGGPGSDLGYDIALGDNGNVYATGTFVGELDFNPGQGTHLIGTAGAFAADLLKLDANGNHLWSGAVVCNWGSVSFTGIDVTPAGTFALAGGFVGNLDADPGVGVADRWSDGINSDMLLLQMSVCQPTTGNITVTACDHYVGPDWHWYTETGIYTTVIPNHCGLDSVITLDITIPTVDLTVTNNGGFLTANATNASFQWLDCNNAYAAIAGETQAQLSLPVTGSFAVVVFQNGCSDTSGCWVNGVLANESGLPQLVFEVHPIPSSGKFTVTAEQEGELAILDMHGKRVHSLQVGTGSKDINCEGLPAGIYSIQFAHAQGITTRRMVIVK